jgi:hypothetical protein
MIECSSCFARRLYDSKHMWSATPKAQCMFFLRIVSAAAIMIPSIEATVTGLLATARALTLTNRLRSPVQHRQLHHYGTAPLGLAHITDI